MFNVVLVAPDIPGNTGSIGRTCVALNLRLILIKPYGFELDEKSVRRAGLDYWKYVNLTEYENFQNFLSNEDIKDDNLFFFSKNAKKSYFNMNFQKDGYLIFGSETKGLPEQILSAYQNHLYSLPMFSEKIRSLNLSNAATAACYEALRQLG